ncbi:MAG: tRNA dihydrouridine synthase [Candidatus Nanoarchaeia archaeon]
MKTGNVNLENNLVLSPMAGFTDVAFRLMCKKYGAGLVCTEMVNAKGLRDENKRAQRIIKTYGEGRPFSIQIFGTDIASIKKAAKELEPLTDIISFNCGCPAARIKKTGCGAALLGDPDKIVEIVKALKSTISKPIIMKIRLGNKVRIDYVSLCKKMEKAGVDSIIVHGRTAKEGYSGHADWEAIGECVRAVKIPVIANGDVVDGPSAKKCLEVSGAAGICIGRAALGDPKVFERISKYLEDGTIIEEPSREEKLSMFLEYVRLAVPSGISWPQILHQAQCFTKGLEGGKHIRAKLSKAKTVEAIEKVMGELID